MSDSQISAVKDCYQIVAEPGFSVGDFLTLRRFLCGNPKHSDEGLFERTIYSPSNGETCLQAVMFYRRQLFPYHLHDFAPLFLYLNEELEPIRVLYDSGHHRVRRAAFGDSVVLALAMPWHQYLQTSSLPTQRLSFDSHHLSDDLVARWILREDAGQIKLRSTLTDPWADVLFANDASFRDRTYCPNCGRSRDHDFMDRVTRHELAIDVACKCGVVYSARYDAARALLLPTKNST